MDPRHFILDLAERLYICSRLLTQSAEKRKWPMPVDKMPSLAVVIVNPETEEREWYGVWWFSRHVWRVVRPKPDELGRAVFYELHVDEFGEMRCNCWGYTRHGKCKHSSAVLEQYHRKSMDVQEPIRSHA